MSPLYAPTGCTCGQMIYEAGCGIGHVDQSLCEACERQAEASDSLYRPIPVGVRLENPGAWPVAFADCGRVFYRGDGNYFRWWPIDLAKSIAHDFGRKGWRDLAEPLREAIAAAEAYQEPKENA